MKYINDMSFRSKLTTLLFLISFGVLASGAIGFFNMHKMKKNLDSLYFGSLIPLKELHTIQNLYNKNLIHTFYQLKQSNISSAQAIEEIRSARINITHTWEQYLSHFKRDFEYDYLSYAQQQMQAFELYLKKLEESIQGLSSQQKQALSANILVRNISNIDKTITEILEYETQLAQYDRKAFSESYDDTVIKLISLMIIIISLAIVSISPIFKSIKLVQDSLEKKSKQLQAANKRLELASITDALTGLHNRRYFNLVYNRELTRAIREEKSFAFMMLDVDNFKKYNDFYGHLQGDKALKAVADTMKETFQRPGDFVFRLGGEEFGVFIYDIDEENAYAMAERLRINLLKKQIPHEKNDASEYLSTSIGVIALDAYHGIDSEAILHQADENLYIAKKEGRNTTVISNELEELHSA